MKFNPIPLFVLMAAGAVVADDAPDAPVAPSDPIPPAGEKATLTEPPPVGRYQMTDAGGYQLMVDTTTGRVWQVQRRGLSIALTPVLYEHGEDISTPLPVYTPEPQLAPGLQASVAPEVTAERIVAATEFVNVTLAQPMISYMATMGQFPPKLSSLAVNVQRDPRWEGPYIKETVIDPWGNPYRYQLPGVHNPDTYDVWSLGPDGVESEDDIGNW